MYFVIVGTLLLLLKVGEISPVSDWSWWWVLSPFALAAVWWAYSDATGLTQRRAMQKIEDRKEARRRKAYEALGIDPNRAAQDRRKAEAAKRAQEARIEKVEGKRAVVREKNEETVAKSSQFSTSFGDIDSPKPTGR